MEDTTAVLITLVLYNAILIGVGLWARGRNEDVEDFYLGGRGLGAWVAAVSASASSSSAWTLLGVSGAAYAWGLPALWLFAATVGGFMVNWLWVAKRLKNLAGDEQAVTVSAVVAPPSLGESRQLILRIAAIIIVFSFVFYVASQFEAAGKAFDVALLIVILLLRRLRGVLLYHRPLRFRPDIEYRIDHRMRDNGAVRAHKRESSTTRALIASASD